MNRRAFAQKFEFLPICICRSALAFLLLRLLVRFLPSDGMAREPYPISKRKREQPATLCETYRYRLRPRDVVLLKTERREEKKSLPRGEKEKKRSEKTTKRGWSGRKRDDFDDAVFSVSVMRHEYSSTRICIGFSFEKK